MNTAKLVRAFASGSLLHPTSSVPSFLDFTHTLAAKLGVSLPGPSEKQTSIAKFMGDAEHWVFVLVDGMGWELLNLLAPTTFLRSQKAMELRAIFPSTTACAMTTLATGLWPGQHGVPGWWAYLAERGLSVTTLPFEERHTHAPLDTLGVAAEALWPFASWRERVQRDSLTIQPREIIHSTFSNYLSGGSPGCGYQSICDAVDIVAARLDKVTTPSFTYLYLPEFDTVCHRQGVDHPQTAQTLATIDAELKRLVDRLNGRARLVISADHGHTNIPEANRISLQDGDSLLELLLAPPTGEPRVPVFHVRKECESAFVKLFGARFPTDWVLLPTAQAAEMKLLGPEPLSPLATSRFGIFMGIATELATIQYQSPLDRLKPAHIGFHAGLSPAEMRIPLIVV